MRESQIASSRALPAVRVVVVSYACMAAGWIVLTRWLASSAWHGLDPLFPGVALCIASTAGLACILRRRELHYGSELAARDRLWRAMARRAADLEAIFDAAPVTIALVRRGMVEYVNPTVESTSGIDRAALIGKPVRDWFSDPTLTLSVRETAQAVIARGEVFVRDVRLWRKDLKQSWVRIHVRALDARDPEQGALWLVEDIDASKCIEEQLRLSEERWQFALEGSEQGVWDWDLAAQRAYYSPRLKAMLGYGEQEYDASAVMDAWQRWIHPDDLPNTLRELERHLTGQTPSFHYQYRMRRSKGDYIWIQTHGKVAERDAEGHPLRFVGTNTDVSKWKAAERALRTSEQLQRSLLDALPIGMYRIDRAGHVIFANRHMIEMLGARDESEIVGRCVYDYVRGAESDKARKRELSVLDGGVKLTTVEAYLSPVSKERRYLEITRLPHRNAAGEIVGLNGLYRDITDKIRADENQRLAALVFESSHQAVVILDKRGRMLAVNRAFSRFTGFDEPEVLGCDIRMLRSGCHDQQFYDEIESTLGIHNRWEGEMWMRRKNGTIYPSQVTVDTLRGAEQELENVIFMFTDVSERKASEERIRYLAQYDVLTNLPNRTLLRDRLGLALEKARREHSRLAVMFLDLDRFKNVNDSLGHHYGDLLLSEAAQRLLACVRASDTVSRHGGDEFIVLLPDVHHDQDVEQIARKLIAAIDTPFIIEGREIVVSLSVGISVFPDSGEDIDHLLRNADTALYAAKDSGRKHYCFYSAEMNSRAAHRLDTENELRRAVERDELFLEYQPQFELTTRRVVGAEALVRWRHPRRGIVSPGEFIPIAEESGLIIELGNWVMENACRQYAEWLRMGLPAGQLAVNVSGHQFRQPNFVASVIDCLERTGLDPRRLELEVTETVIMQGSDHVLHKLHQLEEIGVALAIDDFGTGYSSLSYLKLFPLDRLKVDQAFVRGLPSDRDDGAIVRAIVGLGQNLKLNVLAEGIETQEQFEFLQTIGCHVGQGFYFSRPMTTEVCEAFLCKQRHHHRETVGQLPSADQRPLRRASNK